MAPKKNLRTPPAALSCCWGALTCATVNLAILLEMTTGGSPSLTSNGFFTFPYAGQLFCTPSGCFPAALVDHILNHTRNINHKFATVGSGGVSSGGINPEFKGEANSIIRHYRNPERRIEEEAVSQPEIYGGMEARDGEFPFQVYISSENPIDGKTYQCGGTIYTNHIILSAAHCVCQFVNGKQFFHDRIQVYVGDVRAAKGDKYEVNEFSAHPDFQGPEGGWHNDVAVLYLRKPLVLSKGKVDRLPLATFRLPVGARCRVSGWGATETVNSSPVLLYTTVRTKPSRDCERPFPTYQDDRQVCAGDAPRDSCRGDSGGPMTCVNPKTGKLHLYGIVSYGPDECGIEPGIYTRVDYWRPWIQNKTKEFHLSLLSTNKDPVPGVSWGWGQQHKQPGSHLPLFPLPPFHAIQLHSGKMTGYQYDRLSASFARHFRKLFD